MIIHWIFLILVLWTVPSTSLTCFKCFCPSGNLTGCNFYDAVVVEEGSHCTIVEDFNPSDTYIELSSAYLNSTYVRIKDPYYILVDKSIFYNETSSTWETKTKRVVHGCDWDFCNKFLLIESLPDTFQLTINSSWLNDNIYGTGTVTSCNNCSNQICGNETNPINYDLCPFTQCENSTTCSLDNLWQNVDTNEYCYQSQCTPPSFQDEFSEDDEKYKVQVEAIVYLAQNRSKFDIWELSINCAVDNCTRSTIFQEIKELIDGEGSNLTSFPVTRPPTTPSPPTTLSTPTTPIARPLICYDCSCSQATCPCTTYETSSADNTYCTIIRESYGQYININYGHININSSRVYIREYPYVLVEESIIYNEESGRWNTQVELVVYGCNWDYCNKPELLPYLPASFQMRLPESWLNSTILGSGLPVRDCHECPEAPQCSTLDFLNATSCPIEPCNTTCLVSDIVDRPENDLQCYQSFCAPPDSEFFTIDPHRVQIEGILYASRRTTFEVWEIDLFCRGDNCSRPEVFRELREQLIVQTGDLTVLFNQTVEEPKLRCFDCSCVGEEGCTCNTVTIENARTSYCTITRTYDGENVYVYFGHLDISTSYSNVRELPFVIAKESILYNNETGQWFTRTNEVVFGCNLDYCNKPSLLPLLPGSLQMNLPASWLNSTLIGTGEPVHSCNECANASICTVNNTADGSLCPVQACTTTCFVSNDYSNPTTNEQCYLSYCLPQDSEELGYDKYRVEITAIIYSSQPTPVELWEVYIYCQVDNCSRPEIFQEIKNELNFTLGNTSVLFNYTGLGDPGQLYCYDCYCINDPVCACNTTRALPDGETYCTVIREYDGQNFWIILEHLSRNSSLVYISEFPFMLVEESILYNEMTSLWITRPNLIVYGCNTDFCNDPRLIPSLPISFQMRLSDEWLNTNVLGTGQPTRECHECPDAPQCGTLDFLDTSRCPVKACNTTCLVSDIFDDPSIDQQCYQSFCAPPNSDEFQIDPHRVEIEGIFYGNRLDAQVELWEVDIYCQADDCSRPEIFKELQAELQTETGDLSAFFNLTFSPTTTTTPTPPVKPPLSCYSCGCFNDPTCPCTTVVQSDPDTSYCTIIRLNFDTNFIIDLEPIDRNSTRVYIRKFPFILAEESILYNETSQTWWTRSNILIYGCNWNLCNNPRLVPLVPDSFKMTLSDEWLNANVLDSGAPTRDCHECPEAPQCGTTDFLDVGRCPVRACNTTCVVSDTFDDPINNELCYQSYCNSPEGDSEENQHRVELEGIIYADQRDVVELWEIDIYCRADDCSRPEIFNEIRDNLTTLTSNLTLLFDNSTTPFEPQRICYDCFCFDNPNCVCDKFTVADAATSYCIVTRENFGDDFLVNLQHIARNSTRVYIREFPYLLVEESIIYDDETAQWNTRTNLVVYGCNWDYCNDPKYIPYLPASFQMRLNETWLNTNVLGTGAPIRDCHECPEAPQCGTFDFLDVGRCPVQACNTTCLVSDIFDIPESEIQCYQSFCAPPDSEFFTIDPHRVELEGVLYLNRSVSQVELWEIDVFCRADDCSRPSIFDEIRQQLTVQLGDLSIFYGNATTVAPGGTTTTQPISTTSGSTTPRTGTTTVPTGSTTVPTGSTTTPSGSTASSSTLPGQTTPRPGDTTTTARPSGASTCMKHNILISFFFLISLINLY